MLTQALTLGGLSGVAATALALFLVMAPEASAHRLDRAAAWSVNEALTTGANAESEGEGRGSRLWPAPPL